MLAQLSEPPAILVVCLFALQSAHMLRVDQHQIKLPVATLEYIANRHPINSRRFHHHSPNLVLPQELAQLFQIIREGSEQPSQNLQLLAFSDSNANIHALFVHVQTGAAAVY
jgi:hypothetical protein